ncbi:hypothetical protein B0J12DRAFT_718870 [Macrophomina phaseolina]|uniref:FAD-binding PCMH-type domain-containing protein n=1 Tax=Macrophomina phaseolina TaxID=35725 RepID=A0ABQ8GCJ0_9PEZI|nr:hypothetical protein B0J12DRAFT_718870 [Macrophomina phaseolina]
MARSPTRPSQQQQQQQQQHQQHRQDSFLSKNDNDNNRGESLTIHTPSSPTYESLRTRFFNARLPACRPSAIHLPTTTAQVAAALAYAARHKLHVGVRSGGHNFAAPSLVAGGLLLDVRGLNKTFAYDRATQIASFGPGYVGGELCEELRAVGRFWPFGHSPTVGVGGFVVNGGQGWFMRGWGATAEWVEALEIVTAGGDVVVASRTAHADLFWAARGGGRAFFGVVTRIWGRTVPIRRVWNATLVFAIKGGDGFEDIMEWVFETDEGPSPMYGVETAVVTCWPDREEEGAGDEVVSRELLLVVNCTAWADSLEEASTLLRPWAEVPNELVKRLMARVPVKETTWEELFKAQDQLNPTGNGERWQCDSIFNDPRIQKKQLIEAIKPAFCDLPTRKSVGCLYISDYVPDEEDQAMCLPQQYHISTMTCWHDPAKDEKMKKWMHDAYSRAQPVSCGQYVADFDERHRITKVMTDKALRRFLQIREKYDPHEMFIGHRGLARALEVSVKL